MLNRTYFKGLNIDPVDNSWPRDIIPVRDGRYFWYICTYDDGKKYKQYVFDLIRKYGKSEDRGTWDLHHIVEGQHYADVDAHGNLPMLYDTVLPCILISCERHHALNSLLHCSEADIFWRDQTCVKKTESETGAIKKESIGKDKKSVYSNRLLSLRRMYNSAYYRMPVLQRIANNIFDAVSMEIKRL